MSGNEKQLSAGQKELAELVRESTEKNRQFFALYLGLLVYVLLMVFATTDQMLLVPTQGIRLPLIDVTLPLLGFYWAAPLFLLAIHFNLLQNLESHHYKLMRWRDACGGRVPRKDIPAFLFDYEWLEQGSKMEWWVRFGSRILFLHSGPFALGTLLWRFTDYQDIAMTSWHLLAFTADTYLVWLTEQAFNNNQRPEDKPSIPLSVFELKGKLLPAIYSIARFFGHLGEFFVHLLKTAWRRIFGLLVLLQFGIACMYQFSGNYILTAGSITRYGSLLIPMIYINPNETAWVPDTKEFEAQALLAGEEKVSTWWKTQGKGLNLEGRHLSGFSAPETNLPKLKLDEQSVLDGAYLESAQLQGAYLSSMSLRGADLAYAELPNAYLFSSQMQGTDLRGANLKEADLSEAQLQAANLAQAKLQGANLIGANFQGADLTGAQLQGANLRGAQLQGSNLASAQLQGADLRGAQLQGADLTGAQLQGAIVSETALGNAILPQEANKVAYRDVPFSAKEANWGEIETMSRTSPNEDIREAFSRITQKAKIRPPNTEEVLRNILPNKIETAWKELLPAWDKNLKMKPDPLLAAARGLRRNYAVAFNSKYQEGRPVPFHPEYFHEINKAFCASQRMKELCQPEFSLPPPKPASGLPAKTQPAH
ncbi:MAG TPA: pentapeptide repeat-containing protein [Gallionella sp.]|nr:pentapeptide repeat-containing protein [Gallionella sp.]